MKDILLASGPIYFLILTIIVIIGILGLLFKRAMRKKYKDVNVNIYDPEKEAAEKARKAKLTAKSEAAEAIETAEAKAEAEAPETAEAAEEIAEDTAETGEE